jgi:iron complex transport system permease protein
VLAPILLVGAHMNGRLVVRPAELSVGIVTASEGGGET